MATETEYNLIEDVTKGALRSGYVGAPFDEGLKLLQKHNYKLISSEDNAQLRVQEDYNADISRWGNWILEGALYVKKGNTYLLPIGLPFNHPTEATNAHRMDKEYVPPHKEIERGIAEGLKVLPEYLDKRGNIVVPFNRIGSDTFGIYFFGGKGTDAEKSKKAQAYGDWIVHKDCPYPVKDFFISLDNQKYTDKVGTHANQFWLSWFGSGLYGGGRGLNYASRVRGVRTNSGEAAQKISAEEMKG